MTAKNPDISCALITGAAQRIGATVARTLHRNGVNLCIHYRKSIDAAKALQDELNAVRPDSVHLVQGDLLDTKALPGIIEQSVAAMGRLDLLINNASSFYPTPIGSATEADWDDLVGSNMKAPFFLSQAAAPHLKASNGAIINIVDIHTLRPLKSHTIYCMAKTGLVMMTRSLARELGPEVRVNAVAPGAILWPEQQLDEAEKDDILDRIPLERTGNPQDIADAIVYLASANYVTGQILPVDGGRSVYG